MHSLRNRLEKLDKGYIFYLFLKLVQMNYIFYSKHGYNIKLLQYNIKHNMNDTDMYEILNYPYRN
jgi:hypothetical protein